MVTLAFEYRSEMSKKDFVKMLLSKATSRQIAAKQGRAELAWCLMLVLFLLVSGHNLLCPALLYATCLAALIGITLT